MQHNLDDGLDKTTIGVMIQRFRNAPPTSRDYRHNYDRDGNRFWWTTDASPQRLYNNDDYYLKSRAHRIDTRCEKNIDRNLVKDFQKRRSGEPVPHGILSEAPAPSSPARAIRQTLVQVVPSQNFTPSSPEPIVSSMEDSEQKYESTTLASFSAEMHDLLDMLKARLTVAEAQDVSSAGNEVKSSRPVEESRDNCSDINRSKVKSNFRVRGTVSRGSFESSGKGAGVAIARISCNNVKKSNDDDSLPLEEIVSLPLQDDGKDMKLFESFNVREDKPSSSTSVALLQTAQSQDNITTEMRKHAAAPMFDTSSILVADNLNALPDGAILGMSFLSTCIGSNSTNNERAEKSTESVSLSCTSGSVVDTTDKAALLPPFAPEQTELRSIVAHAPAEEGSSCTSSAAGGEAQLEPAIKIARVHRAPASDLTESDPPAGVIALVLTAADGVTITPENVSDMRSSPVASGIPGLYPDPGVLPRPSNIILRPESSGADTSAAHGHWIGDAKLGGWVWLEAHSSHNSSVDQCRRDGNRGGSGLKLANDYPPIVLLAAPPRSEGSVSRLLQPVADANIKGVAGMIAPSSHRDVALERAPGHQHQHRLQQASAVQRDLPSRENGQLIRDGRERRPNLSVLPARRSHRLARGRLERGRRRSDRHNSSDCCSCNNCWGSVSSGACSSSEGDGRGKQFKRLWPAPPATYKPRIVVANPGARLSTSLSPWQHREGLVGAPSPYLEPIAVQGGTFPALGTSAPSVWPSFRHEDAESANHSVTDGRAPSSGLNYESRLGLKQVAAGHFNYLHPLHPSYLLRNC